MICPQCGEQFTLWKMLKFWLRLKVPFSVWLYLEKRSQNRELEQLKKLYTISANLTEREHFVCSERVKGKSFEDVARSMVVTRERIRQIQAKALRKIMRVE